MSTDTPETAARRALLYARMALAAAALTFVVIVSSAYMRHVQAGLACDDWPACYGKMEVPAADSSPSPGVRVARVAHRLAATGVLILVVGMLLLASIQKKARNNERSFALVALVITVALAVLGIATPGTRLPAITLGNLLGGYLLLAVLAATVGVTMRAQDGSMRRHAPRAPMRWIALALLMLVLGQAAVGGLIGAQHALLACPTLGSCPDYPLGEFLITPAFDPFHPLSIVDGRVVLPPRTADVHVMHRMLGIVISVLALTVAAVATKRAPRRALALAVLALAMPVLGTAMVVAMPSLPLTLLHNACAALLVATLAIVGFPQPQS